jgi:Retroviral aspartyl protease
VASNYPYKAFPLSEPDPITKLDIAWRPVLKVVLFHQHKRTAPVESIVDTGADKTILMYSSREASEYPLKKESATI